MNKEKVIVIGTGGHAKVVTEIIEHEGKYEIIGFTSVEKIEKFLNYPVLGDDNILQNFYLKGYKKLAMGIGGFKDNNLRRKVFLELKSKGFEFVTVISPTAIIQKSNKIGEGSIIFPGVILNTEVIIGENTIIATGTSIDHETILGNHVLVSAGVTVGGFCIIEDGCLLALGSKIISGIKIGKNSLVAAGAVVVKNVEENQRVFGIPAKSINQ